MRFLSGLLSILMIVGISNSSIYANEDSNNPEPVITESTPETNIVENTPETNIVESTPETNTVESTPETSTVESTPETVTVENTPETSETEGLGEKKVEDTAVDEETVLPVNEKATIVLSENFNDLNIKATYEEGTFPTDIKLVLSAITDDDKLNTVKEAISDDFVDQEVKSIVGIDISFILNGEIVQPNENVKIAISSDTKELENISVIHEEETEFTLIDNEVVDESIEFFSDSFSPFYLVELVSSGGVNVAKIGNVEYLTLNDAVNAATDNDVIELLTDIDSYNKIIDTSLTGDKAITVEGKNIIINGNNHKISWTNDYSGTLFKINAGAGLTINDLNFDGAASEWYADYANASPPTSYVSVPIVKGTNDVTGKASMIINGGTLNLNNSNFSNIYAEYSNTTKIKGNVLCSQNGSFTNINTVSFNHVVLKNGYGGSMYAENGARVNIDKLTVDESISTFGGAIAFEGGNAEIPAKITNSVFKNCLSQFNGGVLFIAASGIEVLDSEFTNNKSGNDGTVICFGQHGNAATPLTNYTSNFNNVLFDGNKGLASEGQSMGGVIYFYQNYYGFGVNFNDCTFTNNDAAAGGVLSDVGDLGKSVVFDNCKLISNTAKSGGAFYLQSMHVTLKNSLVENNGSRGTGGVGSVFYVSSLTLENTVVQNNNAVIDGGAFRMYSASADDKPTLILKSGSEVKNNTAGRVGGAVYVNTKSALNDNTITGIIMEAGSKLYNNTAATGGDDIAISTRDKQTLNLVLVDAFDMNAYDVNGNRITGWFWDKNNSRYVKNVSSEYTELTYNGPMKYIFIKAANSDYTIIYDKNNPGATGTMDNQLVLIHPNNEVNLAANRYSLSNKIFLGWSTTANGTVEYTDMQSVDFDLLAGETITLYAIWKDAPIPVNPQPNDNPQPTGRSCQDDGYPNGYFWDEGKQACVYSGYVVPNTKVNVNNPYGAYIVLSLTALILINLKFRYKDQ